MSKLFIMVIVAIIFALITAVAFSVIIYKAIKTRRACIANKVKERSNDEIIIEEVDNDEEVEMEYPDFTKQIHEPMVLDKSLLDIVDEGMTQRRPQVQLTTRSIPQPMTQPMTQLTMSKQVSVNEQKENSSGSMLFSNHGEFF